jgi:hypothetical protein
MGLLPLPLHQEKKDKYIHRDSHNREEEKA